MNKTQLEPTTSTQTVTVEATAPLSDDRAQVRAAVEQVIQESAFYAAFTDVGDSSPQTFETPRIEFSFD